jgi:hypothetical protein
MIEQLKALFDLWQRLVSALKASEKNKNFALSSPRFFLF